MAVFKQFTYTNNGTEVDFMQGLIDLICGLDESITVEDENGDPTTAAAQYADLTSASKAAFYLNFGNNRKLSLARAYTNDRVCAQLYINIFGAGDRIWNYSNQNGAVMAEKNRSVFIAYIKSESLIVLWIGDYNITAITNAGDSIMKVKTGNDSFTAGLYNINIMGAQFVGSNSSATFSPVFQYSAGAGNVDFIEKAVFVSGGAKAFETEDIKSCSNMPQFASIALPDGRNFFTIATNAMVQIDEES